MIGLVCVALCVVIVVIVVAHSRERQTLLDRIQAPATVISERVSKDVPMLRAVHPDLDDEYWEAQKEQR